MRCVRRGGKPAGLVVLAALVMALGAGCGAPVRQASEPDGGRREHEAPGTEPREGGQARENGDRRGARAVGVATYNVYLGAGLKPLFDAGSRGELVTRAGELYAAMEATDFRERAAALADLLAARAPEVVGLQEVARWERGPAGGDLTVRYDFLRLLLDELAARGTPYRTVAANDNFTGRMAVSATEEARFTDRDVIVVRDGPPASSRPRTSRATSAAYGAQATLPSRIPGLSFEVPRGWSSVDVTVRGGTFRFATTHLEAFGTPDVRAAQARELAAALAGSPHPVVLTGDFNSRPTDASGAYGILAGAGYTDAWTAAGGDPDGGWTAGQSGSLLAGNELSHRIDHVLYRPDGVRAVTAEVVGDREADRSAPTGFWPSDHAGVLAGLRFGGGR